MSTTTIRLGDELEARVVAAAERAGKTAHAFMLDAIAHTVEQAELGDNFHRVADERWAKVLATGKTIPWETPGRTPRPTSEPGAAASAHASLPRASDEPG